MKVFELNNLLIKSVKTINEVMLRRLFKMFIAVLLLLVFLFAYVFQTASEFEIEGDVVDDKVTNNDEL